MNKTYPSAVDALRDILKDGQKLSVGGFGLFASKFKTTDHSRSRKRTILTEEGKYSFFAFPCERYKASRPRAAQDSPDPKTARDRLEPLRYGSQWIYLC